MFTVFTSYSKLFLQKMPFPGGNFVGFGEGKSSTPVSGYQTADYWADLIGSSNSSTLLPGFDNQTADSGTDLYGSREKYWIPITIVILTVSLIILIFFFKIGPKVCNFIFCTE